MTVVSNLTKAIATIEAELAGRNEAAAILIENKAKELCPIDTGRLRSSITHETGLGGAVVGTNVEYAPFVHSGTRYQQPQPFLTDAVQQVMGELQTIYGGRLR